MRPGSNDSPAGLGKEITVNILLLVSSYMLFFLSQYSPLFAGETLAAASVASTGNSHVSFHIYLRALIYSLLVIGTIVASTVTIVV